MKFLFSATAMAAAVLATSAALAQVTVQVYSSSSGGESIAEAQAQSHNGSRVDVSSVSISQRGGVARSDVKAKGVRGAGVKASAEAVTQSGIARATNRSIGKGNADVDTIATAESVDGEADAAVFGKGVADPHSRARVSADSWVLGRGTSAIEAQARARRGGDAKSVAVGGVERWNRPGKVQQRVVADATDGGRATSRGEAYDLD